MKWFKVVSLILACSVVHASEVTPQIRIEPETLSLGYDQFRVLLDLPEGTQGWSYGICIEDCDRARFLGIIEGNDDYWIQWVPPPDRDFSSIKVGDCEITRGIVFDMMGELCLEVPVVGMSDYFSVELESTGATTVGICESAGFPPTPVVFVVEGNTIAFPQPYSTADINYFPCRDLEYSLHPLACHAWRVDFNWTCREQVDAFLIYHEDTLITRIAGHIRSAILYDIEAGPMNIRIQPVIAGMAPVSMSFQVDVPTNRGGFIRGDANQDNQVGLADAITILEHLFKEKGLFYPPAADVNGDMVINIADPIMLLEYMFADGNQPASPFPDCGW